jgi:hypothetical protein
VKLGYRIIGVDAHEEEEFAHVTDAAVVLVDLERVVDEGAIICGIGNTIAIAIGLIASIADTIAVAISLVGVV